MSEEKSNEKVLIIQNSNHKNGPRLTMADYGRSVKHFKWWIIGISLACGLVGYLGSNFILNPSREKMTTNIEYSLALNSDENGKPVTYLDGTSYKYSDIISEDNIRGVLAQKDENGNAIWHYDYGSLMNKNAFSIAPKQYSVTTGEDTTTLVDSDTQFIITTTPAAFGGADNARNFLRALVKYEINRASNAIGSYSFDYYLPSTQGTFQTMEFSTMVDQLSNQYKYLSSAYGKMMTKFSGSFVVDGRKISDYYREFTANYTESQFASLSGRLLNDKLVNISSTAEANDKVKEYANLKASYEKDFKEILSSLTTNRALLASLTSIAQPTENIAEQINNLTASIESLQKKKQKMIFELENIGYSVTETETEITVKELPFEDENHNPINTDTYLYKLKNHDEEWIQSCVKFKTDLCVLFSSLDNDTDSASKIYRTAYQTGNYNTIIVTEANMGTLTGHISNMIVAGIGLVGGYLATSFVFAEIYINKPKKDEPETAE